MRRVWAFVLCLLAAPAPASEIVGALSHNQLALTANFSGSEILIFGAIQRDLADLSEGPEGAPYDIAITVEGPREPVAIWRRERVLGIWMNTEQVTLAAVPSFYAVATTEPLADILSPEADAEFRISPALAIRPDQAVADPAVLEQSHEFTDALLRIRAREAQYQALDRFVWVESDILFRARVSLPANLTEGAYTTRMYLLRDGQVVHQFRTAIFVRKDGLEQWIYQTAQNYPLLYGFLALLVALLAGWGAQAFFSLRRNH